MRPRQIASVALVLALTAAGFVIARLLGEADARRDSERRADVAAAQIHGRVAQAASLTESLQQFMLDASGTGVTSDQFASNALRWLSPAGFPAAAWAEPVPDSRREAYEREIGQPLVTSDARGQEVPVGSRSSYLPATLVSGFQPMAVPGTDLSREPGMARALALATRLDQVTTTTPGRGAGGLFLVASAPNLVGEVLHPGYVVVFASNRTLRAAARATPAVRITAAGTSSERENVASSQFTEAGQRFDVLVPREAVSGVAAVVPWIVLAAGLILAALAAALGVSSARRAKAQDELDRIFTLSPDLIAVADFEGHFTRVNPAVEEVLGYTQEEFVGMPYLDLVHPDDRERTAAEATEIGQGSATRSFENRYLRKDGSHRVLEWTSTPVLEDGAMYGMARDVTERRRAEAEATRLADEHAALRRVATLVAEGGSPAAVLDAVAAEIKALLDADQVALNRFEPGEEMTVLAHRGLDVERTPVGSRVSTAGESATAKVRRTGRPARMEGYESAGGALAELARATRLRSSVSAPITVEGRLWGLITASWTGEQSSPADTEQRMAQFAQLLDTAIANADSRDQLTASRARLVTAADDARRRVVRDLHDGAQQRLVHMIVTLKLAQQAFRQDDGKAEALVGEALGHAERSNAELRELAHGILPAVLARGGLRAAVDAVVARLDLPVRVDVPAQRFPVDVEASAYFTIAEALTNVVKHARADTRRGHVLRSRLCASPGDSRRRNRRRRSRWSRARGNERQGDRAWRATADREP